jgi:hypothetical protein
MRRLLFGVVLFCSALLPSLALAQTTVTAELAVGYTEPSTVVTGAPLKSLQYTTIYYETRDEGGASLDQWTTEKPATASSGGGQIVHTEARAVSPQTKTIWIWASATNDAGMSKKTDPIVKTPVIPEIDIPDRPFNLTVTVTVTVQGGTP